MSENHTPPVTAHANPWFHDVETAGCLAHFPLVTQKTLIYPSHTHTSPDQDLLLTAESKPGKEQLGYVRLRCTIDGCCTMWVENATPLLCGQQATIVLRTIIDFVFNSQPVAQILLNDHPFKADDAHAILDALGFMQAPQGLILERGSFRSHTTRRTVLVSAAALIDPDNRILLQKRPAGKPMAGLWEFPGGKVDPGETPEQALVRELYEELGIDIRTGCLAPLTFASHHYDDFHLLMPLYICRQWEGTPRSHEEQELAWVSRQALRSYPMPEADLPLIPILDMWL
nr:MULTISPECIES: (deoxy)nucleoside triphosphate pyrophosphohydrolase [unclassified Haematospirillum]